MSLSDMLDAIYTDNLDELRTLVSLRKCSDTLRNTLLREAVVYNKKAITEFLLQVGSNPNSAVYSSTPLHIAASNGNLEIIQMLLNHGADKNAKDSLEAFPLMYAIIYGENDAAQLLLKRGARLFPNIADIGPLNFAVTQCSLKITKMLLKNGPAFNTVITSGSEKGYTALHCTCPSSRVYIDIIKLLFSNEAGVDLKTQYGLTPLHIASQIGNVQVINLLLDQNSDIDGRANNGYTPLYLAIESENEGAALLLINRGAKLDDKFRYRETILCVALRRGLSSTVEEILTRCPDPQGEIAKCKQSFRDLPKEIINILLKYCFDIEFFHTAIRQGYIQIIESVLKDRLDLTANFDVIRSSVHIAVKSGQIKSLQVLIAHGADVNVKDETGMTPLLNAVVDNNFFWTSSQFLNEADVKIAQMLLAAGADVNAATRTEKLTPLHLACERKKSKLVQVFLDHNADVNLRDKNGQTAIHLARRKCNDSTKLLLENKANVNSQDIFGLTALHMAIIFSKNLNVVKLLLKFGADINIKSKENHSLMHFLNRGPRYYGPMYEIDCLTLKHALALEAINLYDANNLRSSLSKFESTDRINMEKHFENCKQEIEKLKFVNVPGYQLTCYALMTRSIHSVASYVKTEDLITYFESDYFTTEFPIYAPIIEGRLRNAFQRRPLIGDANEFFRHHFQLPYVCVDHILSCLSSDDLQNLKDAMLVAASIS